LNQEKDGVDATTESFIEARYSHHDIPPNAARQVEPIWETLRRALKKVLKSRLNDQLKNN
jgi:hypothetical protein